MAALNTANQSDVVSTGLVERIARHEVAVDQARSEFDFWCRERSDRASALQQRMQELRSSVASLSFRTGKPK